MTERVGLVAELNMEQFNRNYKSYITAIQKMNSETLKTVTSINKAINSLSKNFETSTSRISPDVTKVTKTVDTFRAAMTNVIPVSERLEQKLREQRTEYGVLSAALDKAQVKHGETSIEAQKQMLALQKLDGAIKQTEAALRKSTQTTQTNTEATRRFDQVLELTYQSVKSFSNALLTLGVGFASKMASMGAAITTHIITGFKNAALASLEFGSYLNDKLLTTIKRVGIAAGIAAIAMIKMGKDPVSAAAEVEAQLSRVQAVIGLTKDQAGFLKDAVMELGIDPRLVVTTKEAADIMEMLAKNGIFAGKSLQEMEAIALDTGRAIVYLANSTGADFGQATDIATDVMLMFNKEAKDMTEVVAGIIGVTTNSKFTIHDYELALRNGGAAAASFGVALEDFNTIIALTAEETGRGRRAGTGFANVMYRLVPVSDKAADTMRELGIITADGANRFFDAQGNMQDFTEVVKVLNETFVQTRTAILEVSSLTPQQQQLLKDLKVEYANAEKVIDEYTNGVKSLTASEEVRNKKIAEAQAIIDSITPKIQELTAVESDWIEKVIEMSDAQEIQALRTIFGRDALASVIGLMKEGAPVVEQFTDRSEAVAEVINMIGVSQEEANKMLDEGVTYFDLMRIRLEQIDPEEMARVRMENLKGSLEKLNSVIETLWIMIGNRFLPTLTKIVDKTLAWLTKNKELQAWLEGVAAGFAKFIDSVSEGQGFFDSVLSAIEEMSDVVLELLRKDAMAIASGEMSEFAERGGDVAAAMVNARGRTEEFGEIGRIIQKVTKRLDELYIKAVKAKQSFEEFTTPFIDFYTKHSEPIKQALKAIGVLIGVLMISSAVVSALALLFSPVTGLILLIGALAFAWEDNFGGIQDAVFRLRDSVLTFLDDIGVLDSFSLGGFKQVWEDMPQILQNVADMISNIDWESAYTNLLETTAELGEKLGQKVAEIDWREVGNSVGKFLGKAIIGAVGLLAVAAEAIVTFFRNFFATVDLKNVGEAFLIGLGEGFSDVTALLAVLKEKFQEIDWGKVWSDLFFGAHGLGKSLATALNNLDLAVVGEKIIVGITEGIIAAIGILAAIGSIIWAFLNGIFSNIDWASLWQGFVTGSEKVLEKYFDPIVDAVVLGFKKMVLQIVNYLWGEYTTLTDWAKSVYEGFIKFFTDLYNELVGNSIIPDMVNAIIEWFNTLGIRVLEYVLNLVVSVLRWIYDLYNKFITYISDLITVVTDRVGKFVQKFIDKIIELKDSVVEKVKEMWEEFVQNVEDSIVDIMKKVVKFVLDIIKAFEDKKQEFFDAGANIIDGLIDGINDKLVAAIKTITDFGQSLWEAWTNFWNMKSPSKLMEDSVKNDLMGAVDIGIVRGTPAVLQTMENAASSLFSSFLNRTNDILPFAGNRNPVQSINNTSTRNITLNNNFTGNPQITDANQLELLLAGY